MNEERLAKFIGKERTNIETLERRLQWLRDDPASVGGNTYVAAEIQALTWVLDVVLAGIEPLDTRTTRLEQQMRRINSRLARIERELKEEEDE